VTKSAFDQTPNLTETFDQVKRSSEIRSSECFPVFIPRNILLKKNYNENIFVIFQEI
jgi:hypothetical protein